mmetsp:Transcript_21771/g.49552  ORF Transcript_21771/g.49552 Transcript_21771/m.49552 type:complete len:238 (+) Transcript_21771:142-855(+)|eukprot:6469707-Amphidinium_carterae.1
MIVSKPHFTGILESTGPLRKGPTAGAFKFATKDASDLVMALANGSQPAFEDIGAAVLSRNPQTLLRALQRWLPQDTDAMQADLRRALEADYKEEAADILRALARRERVVPIWARPSWTTESPIAGAAEREVQVAKEVATPASPLLFTESVKPAGAYLLDTITVPSMTQKPDAGRLGYAVCQVGSDVAQWESQHLCGNMWLYDMANGFCDVNSGISPEPIPYHPSRGERRRRVRGVAM